MSVNNGTGVIRIGRKGIKKFAFGEDGKPFDVDVVVAFQQWINIDESFRQHEGPEKGVIKDEDMPAYHHGAVEFVKGLTGDPAGTAITTAEALDFIARLREQYDELADFFRPKKREKVELPVTSAAELRFSVEEQSSPSSTN